MEKVFNIKEAAELIGIGRTRLYQIVSSGELKAKKFGKRTLILEKDLTVFLHELEPYPTKSNTDNGDQNGQ